MSDDNRWRLACSELSRRLRAGEECRSEEFLAKAPFVDEQGDAVLELLYTEFVVREELGHQPQPESWYQRFPAWRSDLEELFQVHRYVCQQDEARLPISDTVQHAPDVGENSDNVGDPVGGASLGTTVERIGQYEIQQLIARGGMGIVYRARQTSLDRDVALKLITTPPLEEQARDRFRREASTTAQLNHPQIVSIYEVGHDGDRAFIAMEFVDGGCLADQVSDGPFQPRRAAEVVETLARTVQFAHDHHIVHRDLKPANVLFTSSGALKIADFGLAKHLSQLEEPANNRSVTLTGAVIGTPCYMAPEQAAGRKDVGHLVDVYALGAILYELLTGRPPFQGDSVLETLQQIQQHEPATPRRLRPGVPRDLETITLKCLEKEPHRRYGSALEIAEDLSRFLTGRPIFARPVGQFERLAKWSRRRPALAMLSAALLIVTIIGLLGITYQWQRAVQARQAESRIRVDAEDTLYNVLVSQASYELTQRNAGRAQALLDRCDERRRAWEWQLLRQMCEPQLRRLQLGDEVVRVVALDPGERRLAAVTGAWGTTKPGRIAVWDWQTGERLWEATFDDGPLVGLAWSPGGTRLASSSVAWGVETNKPIVIWDAATGEVLARPRLEVGNSFCVVYSHDGQYLAVGGSNGEIHLLDTSNWELIHRFNAHADNIFRLVFGSDDAWLASGSRDGTVKLWDIQRGELIRLLDAGSDVRALAISPDGNQIAAGGWDGVVRIWDRENGNETLTFPVGSRVGSRYCSGLVFSRDGERLYAAITDSATATIKAWNLHTKAQHGDTIETSPTLNLALTAGGDRLVTANQSGRISVWDLDAQPNAPSIIMQCWLGAVDISPDDRELVVAPVFSMSNQSEPFESVPILDLETFDVQRTLEGHSDWLSDVAFSPSGKQIVTSSLDQTVRVWRRHDAMLLNTTHIDSVHCTVVDFLDDSTVIAGDLSGQVHIWDWSKGPFVSYPTPHPCALTTLVILSPSEALFGDAQGRLHLWQAGKQARAWSFALDHQSVDRMALGPEGRLLATAHGPRIKLWEVADWDHAQLVLKQQVQSPGDVTGLAFGRDASRLVVTDASRQTRIINTRNGRQLMRLPGHGMRAADLQFSHDGQTLVVVGGSVAYRWRVESR